MKRRKKKKTKLKIHGAANISTNSRALSVIFALVQGGSCKQKKKFKKRKIGRSKTKKLMTTRRAKNFVTDI